MDEKMQRLADLLEEVRALGEERNRRYEVQSMAEMEHEKASVAYRSARIRLSQLLYEEHGISGIGV